MDTERATASTTIEATREAVFAVLADPSAHADIDGTGWVRGSADGDRITAAGQVFRMAMYHENHPDKDYKMANRVEWAQGHSVPAVRAGPPRQLIAAPVRPRRVGVAAIPAATPSPHSHRSTTHEEDAMAFKVSAPGFTGAGRTGPPPEASTLQA